MAFDVGPHIVSVGFGAVHLLTPPSADWQALETPSSALYGVGGAGLGVWVESDSARLRGWAPDGKGVRTLLDAAPATSCVLGVGDDDVVGVATDACLGGSKGLRFWKLPVGGAASDVRVGPSLPVNVSLSAPDLVRTNGDFAAVLVADWDPESGASGDTPFFIVTRLSTFDAFRVDSIKPMIAQTAMWTLDHDYLYWAEMAKSLDDPKVTRIVRVPLSKLAQVGTPIAN